MAIKKCTLTQERLKELVHYSPITGNMYWLETRGRKIKGTKVGCNAHGYRLTQVDGHKDYVHRLIFLYVTGKIPTNTVDHINHNKSDNRWLNLRLATQAENRKNSPKVKSNKSGVTGVYHNGSVWVANISYNYKTIYLGCSKDRSVAITLRKEAESKYKFHDLHGL